MRGKTFILLLGSLLLTTHDSQLTTALGADGVAPTPKIGFVKLGRLFEEYERTKSSESQLEQVSKTKQTERERLVSEIKGIRDELVLLNEEARSERQQTIEEKLRQLAGFDRQAKDSLRKQRDETVKGILDEIETTVASYAKERGFTMILTEHAVLYGMEALDVTDDILALLNEKYAKAKR